MIESKQNKSFKLWMKLKVKKYRDEYGMFLVFDDDIIDYAKVNDCIVELVSVIDDKKSTLISKELMKLLQPDTDFKRMAVCKKVSVKKDSKRVLILDDVQDPVNLGTLLRSASAFGFNKIYISLKSADLYHEKTIRASKGAVFDCEVIRTDLMDRVKDLKKSGFIIVGTDIHKNKNDIPLKEKIAIVLGNEGNGVRKEIIEICDYNYLIETKNVESLNVAAAGAVLMYIWRSI